MKCVNGHDWEDCSCLKTEEFRAAQDRWTLQVTLVAVTVAVCAGLLVAAPNRITYIYLLSWTGEFIGYYTAKGKVSSNQSQMGPMDQAIDICPRRDESCWTPLEAPGDDGSFGPNEDGIFFFTTDDTKITWNGLYQQSDKPLNIKVPLLYN